MVGLVLTFTDVTMGPATFSIGTLAVCAGLVLIGYQSVWFALLSKSFASREGLLPDDRRVDEFRRRFPLELGLGLSAVAVAVGLAGIVGAAAGWDFQPLDPVRSMRVILPSVTILVLGLQTALCSLLLSILGLPSARPTADAPAARAAPGGGMNAVDRWIRDLRIGRAIRSIPPGARVLDVGCHDGALFRALGPRPARGRRPGPRAGRTAGR